MNPTRIDFLKIQDGWQVTKFAERDGHWVALDSRLNPPLRGQDHFDVDQALAWLEEHGWTVRRWPGGARAWLGKPRVIRTREQIIRLRRQYERFGAPAGVSLVNVDMAYDL